MPSAYNGRLGRGGTPCRPRTTDALVGAALRADRIPTNLGVAQLASHAPPLPQLSHAPDFLISCGACRSGHAGGVPLPREPIGRGGTPCRPPYLAPAHPQIWAWRNWLLMRPPPYPNSRMRPIFSFPAVSAAAVTPEACPYHANPSVGAALRAVRVQRTPRRGVPTNTALVGAALRADRPTSRPRTT